VQKSSKVSRTFSTACAQSLTVDGKWVTDDYDEEAALAKCQEFGITPGSTVHDDEVQPHSAAAPQLSGRGDAAARAANLVPFYSVGGPTTHFGGNGATPVYDAGWGSKRAKLRAMGVTEEDWMLRTAEETRRIDQQLKEYRSDRLVPLEGSDAKPWVYAVENMTESIEDEPVGGKLEAALALTEETKANVAALTPAVKEDQGGSTSLPINGHTDVEMASSNADGIERTEYGKVVVETAEDRERNASKYNWGLGSWQPGVVRAAYEVSSELWFMRRG
jgi:chromatin structure-remodeling complex protein RSC7